MQKNAFKTWLLEWLPVGATMLLPLAAIVSWQKLTHYYPRHDGAYYFETAQFIYLKIKSNGLLSGLHEAYFNRTYKPILHPLFIVPFLFVTGGKVLASIAITNVFFYIAFFVFTYLLSREYLSKTGALITTLLTCTMGWVFGCTQISMSELPQLGSTMATLLYLKRSNFFSCRRNSVYFGIALAFCLCIRPVESTVLLLVPLALWVREGHSRGNISSNALQSTAAAFIVTVLIMAITLILDRELSAIEFSASLIALVIALSGAALLKLAPRNNRRPLKFPKFKGQGFNRISDFWKNRAPLMSWATKKLDPRRYFELAPSEGYRLAFLLGCGLTVIWYLPSVLRLYRWVFAATFGASTMSEVGKERLGLRLLVNSYADLGSFYLKVTVLAAVVALVMPRKTDAGISMPTRDRILHFVAVLFMVIGPPLFGGIAYNQDTRYYFPGAAIAIITACSIALNPERRFFILRTLPILFLCLVNIICWMGDSNLAPIQLRDAYKLPQRGVPLWQEDDPVLTYVKEFKPRVKDKQLNVCLLPLCNLGPTDDVLEYSALAVMARELEPRLNFQCNFKPTIPNGKDIALAEIRESVRDLDYLVIGPTQSRHLYKHTSPKYADYILDRWDANELEPTGLKFERTFPIKTPEGSIIDMVVFKVR